MSDDYITVKKILQNKSRVEITKKEKKKKKKTRKNDGQRMSSTVK